MKRKILFFDVKYRKMNNTNNTVELVNPDITYISYIFNKIDKLPFDRGKSENRYYIFKDDNALSMYVDEATDDFIRGRMATCRKNRLPQLESEGNLSGLSISDKASLAEITHFIYFIKTHVLGVESNYYGPRAASFSIYLQDKVNELVNGVEIKPILKPELDPLLDNPNLFVTLFRVEAYRNAGKILSGLSEDLGSAFDAAQRSCDADVFEICIKARPYSRKGFSLKSVISAFIKRLSGEQKRAINKLEVKAIDPKINRVRTIDVLEDKFTFSKDVEVTNDLQRTVMSSSMYQAIEDSYKECEEDLVVKIRGD